MPTPDYNSVTAKDHGAHREYGLEWWYWVRHLEAVSGGKKYGFQSTVFRVAGDPQNSKANTDDAFGNKQLFLAHAALSDLTNKKYIHHERVARGLAGEGRAEYFGFKSGGDTGDYDQG